VAFGKKPQGHKTFPMNEGVTKRIVFFIMGTITLFLLFLCVFSSATAYLGDRFYFLELASTLQPITFTCTLIMLLFWIAYRSKWVFVAVLSLLISMNYFLAVFQLPKLKKEKSNKTELVVSTYNIQGFGYGQIDLTVQLLSDFMKEKKVDILCFQEFGFSENFTADSIKQRFKFLPYQVITGNEKAGFGMAIFSKYPIVRSTIIRFKSSLNSAMYSDILYNKDTIRVVNFHMQTTNFNQSRFPINPGYWLWDMTEEAKKAMTVVERLHQNYAKRLMQGKALRNQIEKSPYPVIACGDMNANPASYSYKQIKGALCDGFKTSGSGYEYTYRYLFKLLRTDYIFHSAKFQGLFYKSYDLDYSDHKPVIMKVIPNLQSEKGKNASNAGF